MTIAVWTSIIFSAIMLSLAAILVVGHVRTWRATQKEDLSSEEYTFRRHQFRRRMQTSVMLGLAAIAVPLAELIKGSSTWILIYWGGVVLLVVWAMVLALADMLTAKLYFGRQQQKILLEQAKLHAKVKAQQKSPPPPGNSRSTDGAD